MPGSRIKLMILNQIKQKLKVLPTWVMKAIGVSKYCIMGCVTPRAAASAGFYPTKEELAELVSQLDRKAQATSAPILLLKTHWTK